MAYAISTPSLGFPAIGAVDDAAKVAIGTIVSAVDPARGAGEFIYLKGAASTEVGTWVTYALDDGATTRAAANAIGPVAVAMAETVADTYGWYQIGGKAVGKALSGFLDNANVYLTGTAGSVDDTVVAGDYVYGAKGASAVDTETGLAEFEISRPYVKDGLDDTTS